MNPGRCGTFTHGYKRHGTTTLFAALNVAEGRVIGECYPKHRHQEFLAFLKRLDGEFPPGLQLHIILDNYGTHGHSKVRAWLAKHPRMVLHFIPTSSSWLNLVECWFAELSQKSIRRGSFRSAMTCGGRSASSSRHGTPTLYRLFGRRVLSGFWRR